jgi:hypothetical protein
MTYDPCQHGAAEYNSWMHIASADWANVTQGLEGVPIRERKYAQLVYTVNGGGGAGGTVGIDGSGDVKVVQPNPTESGALEVSDATAQVLVKYDVPNNFTYVMESAAGYVTSGESGWRIKRVQDITDTVLTVMWADGVDTFTKVASAYLTYDYKFKA